MRIDVVLLLNQKVSLIPFLGKAYSWIRGASCRFYQEECVNRRLVKSMGPLNFMFKEWHCT